MRNRVIVLAMLIACVWLVLAGCSNSGGKNPVEDVTAVTTTSDGVTDEKANLVEQPSADEEETWDTESLKNETGKTIFRSFTNHKDGHYHATVAMVTKSGTVVIADPNAIPGDNGLVKVDVITISHSHPDHNDPLFVGKSMKHKVKISSHQVESFTVKDVEITSIASSHTSSPINPDKPSDVIYIYDMDGIRVAHFGDMGQDELTEEQLKTLGTVDILFTRFSNETQYSASTQKTIKVLEQVKPKIALATHFEDPIIDEILEKSGITVRDETEVLAVSREELDQIASTKFVMLK